MTVAKEQVMEELCSSPFMGRWREAPEGLMDGFTSPLAGEVGPKGRVGRGEWSSPFMGRWREAPEGLCRQ